MGLGQYNSLGEYFDPYTASEVFLYYYYIPVHGQLVSHRGCSKDGCPEKKILFPWSMTTENDILDTHLNCIDDVPIKLTQFCHISNPLDRGGNIRSNVIEHYSKSPLKSLHYLCSISPHLSQMQGPVEIHIDSEANLSQWVSMADEILGLMVAARTPFRYKVSKLAINNFHMRQSQHLRWLLSMIDKKVGRSVCYKCFNIVT